MVLSIETYCFSKDLDIEKPESKSNCNRELYLIRIIASTEDVSVLRFI